MKIRTLLLGLLLASSALQATEFQPLGFKSTAMGGAGVANASGSMATYYNPALLAHAKTTMEFSLGGGVQYRDNGLGAKAAKLEDDNLYDAIDHIASHAPVNGSNTQYDRDAVSSAVDTIMSMDGESFQIQPEAYLGMHYTNFGFGIYTTTEASLIPKISQNHDQLIFENAGFYYMYDPLTDTYSQTTQTNYENNGLEYALDNGLTNAHAIGILITEIPFSYAYNFDTAIGQVALGGSAKIMVGSSYYQTVRIDNEDDNNDNAIDETTTSTTLGIDLGLIYLPQNVKTMRIGLMLKNLNAPKFNTPDGFKDVTLDPMARLGVSYMLTNTLEIASDLDLTENKMIDDETKSRVFGLGLGWQPISWFNLSGGLMKNLSNSAEGLAYTLGLSAGPQMLHMDLAAQMSNKTNSYQGNTFPAYANIMVALTSSW